MMKIVRYSGSEDWSALYIDGKLDTVADHYLVDERISQLLGVKTVSSDNFMRGGTQRKDVAETIDEIGEYVIAHLEKARQIRELDAKKAELEEEIQRLKETHRK